MFALACAVVLTASAAAPSKAKAKPPKKEAPPVTAPAPAPEPVVTPEPVAVQPEPPRPATVVAPPPPAQPGQLRVGVVDFGSAPELTQLSAALGGYVANELQRLGAFQVTTTDQLRQMLSLERQAQLLGCPDDSCRGQTVVSLGFDYVVTGKVTKLARDKGAITTLELVLLDPKKGERIASDVVQGATDAELLSKISPAVIKLVNAPLKARSGSLVLAASETGATVKIDDVIIGTTPVGQLPVAGGPHFVSVEKTGFVSWQKEVRVKPDELVQEDVRLVPSPDFIAAYKSKQNALRVAMWGSAVLAAAGIVTGVVMGFNAQAKYGNEQTAGTFLYERKFILEGIEVEGMNDHRANANRLKAEVEMSRTFGYVGVGVGAAFGLTAAVLRLLSDDPSRYDLYRSADVKVSLGGTLAPGQGGAVLSGSF